MRLLLFIVCFGATAGCKNGTIATKKVATLDFPSFTVAMPAGWGLVTDKRILSSVPPNGHAIMMEDPPAGFPPSAVVQELPASTIPLLKGATVDMCRDQIQALMVRQAKATAGPVKTADMGAFKGCDIEVVDPASSQATRQFAVTDGKLAVSIVCNRDKKGEPQIDALCQSLLGAIKVK